MNTETGQIYRGQDEIMAAIHRGEPVVPVSEQVAETMEAGQRVMNRAQRRRAAQREARETRKGSKQPCKTK